MPMTARLNLCYSPTQPRRITALNAILWRVQASVQDRNPPKFLLLFGMARSGTSWIGKIFDSHPLTLYKHEPDRVMRNVPMAPRLEDADRFSIPLRRFFDLLPTVNSPHVAGRLPVFPKEYRGALAAQIHKVSVLSSAAASALHRSLPILQCARLNRQDVRVIWKSIDSLGRLGVIMRLVENCRAVRITRHPCGSISSTLRGEAQRKFVSSVSPSEDYGIMKIFLETAPRRRSLSVDHLKKLHPVERMAWIWVLMNEKAEDETQDPKRCTSVRYEDVCSDPVNAVKALFSFSGLTWDEQTSNFIKASTLGSQPGKLDKLTQDSRRYYSIFRDPIRSADRWKTEMKSEDIDRVYSVLRQSDLVRLYPESESMSVRTSCAS